MKLILCGGGSGEQNTLVNNKLNEIIDNSKAILYIPLAMDESEHSYDSCYEWIIEELKKVDKSGIDMVRSFDELLLKDFSKYAAIFLGGGNTYKLLNGIKKYGIFEKMSDYINNDGVIIGGSAGAVIFGKDINIISIMDSNNVNLTNTSGFDAINGLSIFPHYTNAKRKLTEEENIKRTDAFTDAIIDFSNNIGGVIAIPEEDAIFVDGKTIEIIGTKPYYYCKNGNMLKLEVDEKMELTFKGKSHKSTA